MTHINFNKDNSKVNEIDDSYVYDYIHIEFSIKYIRHRSDRKMRISEKGKVASFCEVVPPTFEKNK